MAKICQDRILQNRPDSPMAAPPNRVPASRLTKIQTNRFQGLPWMAEASNERPTTAVATRARARINDYHGWSTLRKESMTLQQYSPYSSSTYGPWPISIHGKPQPLLCRAFLYWGSTLIVFGMPEPFLDVTWTTFPIHGPPVRGQSSCTPVWLETSTMWQLRKWITVVGTWHWGPATEGVAAPFRNPGIYLKPAKICQAFWHPLDHTAFALQNSTISRRSEISKSSSKFDRHFCWDLLVLRTATVVQVIAMAMVDHKYWMVLDGIGIDHRQFGTDCTIPQVSSNAKSWDANDSH